MALGYTFYAESGIIFSCNVFTPESDGEYIDKTPQGLFGGFDMNIIVIGCGRVGAELAARLSLQGHMVVVVDQDEDAFNNLPVDFRGRTVEGEALSQEVLRRAGITEAHGLAAVTSNDSANAVIAHLARTEFKVPVVVVRNFDSRWRSVHEAFGHQVVSPSSWGAQRIEEMLYQQEMSAVFWAGNGEVELYEFTVPDNWEGKSCCALLPESGCILVALTRGGRAMLPDCAIQLQAGDQLLVSATLEGSVALREHLKTAPADAQAASKKAGR
jgi:trk system potassium uptake protein